MPQAVPTLAPLAETLIPTSLLYVDERIKQPVTQSYSVSQRDSSGSDGTAYRTVNAAIAAAKSGDTLWVRSGRYAEIFELGHDPVSQAAFYIDKSLTLMAYQGEPVTLTYPTDTPPLIGTEKGPIILADIKGDLHIEGFIIIGTRPLGDNPKSDTDVNIDMYSTAGTLTIRRNLLLEGGHCGIKFTTGGGALIEQNVIRRCGFTGRDHGIYVSSDEHASTPIVIRHNAISEISGYGIHLFGDPPRCEVYSNVTTNCATGGILIGGADNKVYNNTIYDVRGYGGLVLYKEGTTHCVIENNLIVRFDGGADVMIDGAGGPNEVSHNVFHAITRVGQSHPQAFVCDTCLTLDDTSTPFYSPHPAEWSDLRLPHGSALTQQGISLPAPYDQRLDPSAPNWPTPIADPNGRAIGAFADRALP